MARFASLLTTRPVEEFVQSVVDRVGSAAKAKGWTGTMRVMSPVSLSPGDPDRLAIITIKLKKGLVEKDANIQIKINDFTGQAWVHSSAGFPHELAAAIHNLSPSPPGWQNAQGVQAVKQDDPAEDRGCGEVEGEPDSPSASIPHAQVAKAVVTSIDLATVRRELARNEKPRQYIGASGIGNPCMAYQALNLRGFPGDMPSPQLLRVFDQGHRIEEQVVQMLTDAGHTVEPLEPMTGKQWAYTSHGGHHRAHLDGFITLLGGGDRMTLEIKSMNSDMFKKFVRAGVKISHPDYYDQIIDGLGLAIDCGRVEVTKCMFVAYCKDNSKYRVEIVDFSRDHYDTLMNKVGTAVVGTFDVRMERHKNAYNCTECFKRTSCWEPNVSNRTCAHCQHSTPSLIAGRDRAWLCTLHGGDATATCDSFKLWRPTPAPKEAP